MEYLRFIASMFAAYGIMKVAVNLLKIYLRRTGCLIETHVQVMRIPYTHFVRVGKAGAGSGDVNMIVRQLEAIKDVSMPLLDVLKMVNKNEAI
jgi:hypothetical protein